MKNYLYISFFLIQRFLRKSAISNVEFKQWVN